MFNRLVKQFASQRQIGVDIGSSAIKFVELALEQGQPVLAQCAIVDIKAGESAGVVLQQLLKSRDAVNARIAVGLASPELIVRPMHFPKMPKKELNNAIYLEAEQAILNGHLLNEMAIDWHPLAQEKTEEGLRGLLAVVPKTLVADRAAVFATAGVQVMVMDVEGLALWNAYWALLGSRETAPKTVLLAHVGAQKTNLVIVKGRDELILIRDLQVGMAAAKSGGAEWVEEVRDSLAYARA